MTGRSPARLLAPLALVVTTVALFMVVTSGQDKSTDGGGAAATPTTTTTKQQSKGSETAKKRPKRYTVQPGDTPSAIAEKLDVSLDDLLAANPNADPNALTPGQKLKLP